jgi:phospholipid/cholesterol/gamma-HCH transport system permease protein
MSAEDPTKKSSPAGPPDSQKESGPLARNPSLSTDSPEKTFVALPSFAAKELLQELLSPDEGVHAPFLLLIGKGREAIHVMGEYALFFVRAMGASRTLWKRRVLFFQHCEFIGVQSLGVCTIAAIFLGSVMGYQLLFTLRMFGADALLGGSIGTSFFRELAPVFAAIMVIGRSGAAIAAEISTMRVSEQIDALEVMAVDPVEFLVTPRIFAGFLMMPVTAVYFALVGSGSAFFIACKVMGLSEATFWARYAKSTDIIDIVHCVLKGATFGLVLSSIACFCGFRAFGGAKAVGSATRNTVVASFLLVLLADYLLTSLLPFGFPPLEITR